MLDNKGYRHTPRICNNFTRQELLLELVSMLRLSVAYIACLVLYFYGAVTTHEPHPPSHRLNTSNWNPKYCHWAWHRPGVWNSMLYLYLRGIATRQGPQSVCGWCPELPARGCSRAGRIFLGNVLQRKSEPGRREGRAFCSVRCLSSTIIVQWTKKLSYYC